MAAGDSGDILMKFTLGTQLLPGECSTLLAVGGKSPHALLTGFKAGSMFEIDSFNFGIADEDEANKQNAAAAATHGRQPAAKPVQPAPRWTPQTVKKASKVTVQPITFARVMDTASTLLLHHCIQRTNFDTAALVKRKAAGGLAAGEPYLRLDFKGVMLTAASWSNDNPVKENYTMIARAITLRYRPQLPGGGLGAARVGFWSMQPNASELPLT